MAKKQPLSYVLYIQLESGETVELSQLTPEQREQWQANVRRRLSLAMSGYYAQHPEEYKQIGGEILDDKKAGSAV